MCFRPQKKQVAQLPLKMLSPKIVGNYLNASMSSVARTTVLCPSVYYIIIQFEATRVTQPTVAQSVPTELRYLVRCVVF